MSRWAFVVWVGCGGATDDGAPIEDGPSDELVALAVTGESCDPVGPSALMVFGPQGAFHLELGVLAASFTADIALHVELFENGERIGGTQPQGTFISLADWDDTTGEGWASTQARIADGETDAVGIGCRLDGHELHVVVTACAIENGELCSTVETDLVAEAPPVEACL